MRAYPRYRDSGVEWLGEVPEHWQSGPLQRWFDIVNGGTPTSSEEAYWDGDTVWLTPDDLGQNEGAWIGAGRRTITEEGVGNSSARVTPAGSVVLSTRAPIGHLAITGVPAATNQGCRTLVPSSDAEAASPALPGEPICPPRRRSIWRADALCPPAAPLGKAHLPSWS